MNLSSLQARVRSLRRRLAQPYAQVMVQTMTEHLCNQWYRAKMDKQPTPSPWAFVRHVARAGFYLPTFSATRNYLERCTDERREPDAVSVFRALLPGAEYPTSDAYWPQPGRLHSLLLRPLATGTSLG